jgi:hypothetical protein
MSSESARVGRLAIEGRSFASPSGVPFLVASAPRRRAVRPARYLIIVEREEPALRGYLQQQFADDPEVRVLTDRRSRARPGSACGPFCWIVDSQCSVDAPEGERSGPMEGLEDRQRVDRWIEESQYLIGRMIPGLLDDRERLKGKLEAADLECAKLRQEIGELRKEVSDLQSETQFFRSEHGAMADALREVVDSMSQIQKPLNDVHRRLQATMPVTFSSSAA